MDLRTKTGRTAMQRIAPIVLVGMLGIGAAACGSSSSKVQPGGQGPASTNAPTTQGSSSGGAGF